MPQTDPELARRFKTSSYSGNLLTRLNSAADAAQAYVAGSPTANDLFDDSPAAYTDAKGFVCGPNGYQAIVEDDVGGNLTGPHALRDNVRYEPAEVINVAFQGDECFTVGDAANWSFVPRAGAWTGTTNVGGQKELGWTQGKFVIDRRAHLHGVTISGSGFKIETAKVFDFFSQNAAHHFKIQGMYTIESSDCTSPGYKNNHAAIVTRAKLAWGTAGVARNGIFIDLDTDDAYTGYGQFQIGANYRCLFANCRSHGGILWRIESDGAVPPPSGDHLNWGVDTCTFWNGYARSGNCAFTIQPNEAPNCDNNDVDWIFSESMSEAIRTGQFNVGQTIPNTTIDHVRCLSGNTASIQEAQPCPTNVSRATCSISGGGFLKSEIGDFKYNYGKNPSNQDILFTNIGSISGLVRDITMTPTTMMAEWTSHKLVLGDTLPLPHAPTLTGPSSPQTEPYSLSLSGIADIPGLWKWRLVTNGTPAAYADGATGSTDTKSYPTLSDANYRVDATITNATGTGPVGSYNLTVNNAAVTPPSQGVIATGPAAITTSSSASFTGSAAGSTSLQWSLDGAAFATDTSPHAVTGLAPGIHTMKLHGTNADGVGPDSATYTWTVVGSTNIAALTLTGTSVVDKAGQWVGTTSTNLVLGIPPGTTVNDLLLLFAGWNSAGAIAVPSGWTAVAGSPVVAGTAVNCMCATRIYTGTESTDVTVVGPNANGGSGVILNLTDIYRTVPVADTETAAGS